MKRLRRPVNVFLATAVLSTFVIACNSSPASTTKTDNDPKANVEPLKFSLHMSNGKRKYAETSPDTNKDKWVLELEKRTNTDINIIMVPDIDLETKKQLVFASGNIPDVMVSEQGYLTSNSMREARDAGAFMELNDLIDKYGPNLKKKIPKEAWAEFTSNGKIYAIPEYLLNRSRRSMFIREDLLKKVNKPIPKTVDEYIDVLRAFKQAGIELPLQGRPNFKYTEAFFGAYDVIPTQWEWNGAELVPKFTLPRIKDALKVYRTLYQEKLIDPEMFTTKLVFENIYSGKVGMFMQNTEGLFRYQTELQKQVKDGTLKVIPAPVGPDGKGGSFYYPSSVRGWHINKNFKQPERLIQFFDWIVSDEANNFFWYGIEGENYTVENGKINYKFPTTDMGTLEEEFRDYLRLVKDATLGKEGILKITDQGKELMDVFANVNNKEGRDSFNPLPLKAYDTHPELRPTSLEEPGDYVVDYFAQVMTGKKDVDKTFDDFVAEYKKRGGADAIKEATEKYKKEKGLK